MKDSGVIVYDVFFFFQAEDGIRDIGVTGVQTCALPISERGVAAALERQVEGRRQATPVLRVGKDRQHHYRVGRLDGGNPERSEERCVGEECRSRWSPYPSKKKTVINLGYATACVLLYIT